MKWGFIYKERGYIMQKKVASILFSMILASVSITSIASDNGVNLQEDLGLYETQYTINNSIIEKLKILLEEKPGAITYINNSIKMFEEEIHTNNNEFNEFLNETVDAAMYVHEQQQKEIELAEEEDKISGQEQTVRPLGAEDIAYAAYDQGIKIVKSKGCTQTAKYMEHARDIVGQSGNGHYYHNYDSWAKKCATNQELFYKVTNQFENEVMANGKDWGIVSGDFAYTTKNSSLDQYTALHNVHYAVTFKKTSVGYTAEYDIGDTYDFDWGAYDNFAIGFGNNYCVAMQNLGLIKRFGIDIYWKN